MDTRIRAIPTLLAQAKTNLVGNGRDLWTWGTKSIRQQSADLAKLATQVAGESGKLPADVSRAKEATDSFASWLDSQAASKTEPSGVGVENYNWYLKNVQLVPYTWQDEVTIMERELARSHALLAMEELRNAKLPEPAPIASAADYDRRFGGAIAEYMAFLKDHDVLEVKDYMDPALRARVGSFSPGPREFFGEVDYRDPELMRTHGYHWFDKARMVHEPHPSPIRRGALPYNIFNTRTEGHATGWEELMVQPACSRAAADPRAPLILLAERAARALGTRMTTTRSRSSRSRSSPRGNAARWLSLDGNGPGGTAPLPAAAGLRYELHHRQDRDREAPGRAQEAAGRQVHDEGLHEGVRRRRAHPGVASPLGAHREEVRGAPADAAVKSRKLLPVACALALACARPAASPPAPSAAAPVGFVNRVWKVERSSSVSPDTLYVFLSDGTLVVTSPQGKPSLGTWKSEGGKLTMVEEGVSYPVDVLALDAGRFSIRSHNPGEPVDIEMVPAPSPAADGR